jgi:hypothetical protein
MNDRELTLKILKDIMLHCNSHGIELGKGSDSPLQPVFESASFLFCHLLMKKKMVKVAGPDDPPSPPPTPGIYLLRQGGVVISPDHSPSLG